MKELCWYIKTDKGFSSEAMTFYEAVELADWLTRNKEAGVTIVKGQLKMGLQ
jgi:hypothetical protein